MTFFISLLKLRRRLTSVDILLAYIANLLYRIHCTPRNVCPTRDAIYCLTRRKAADRLGRVALLTSIGIGISQTSKSYVCATRRSTQHPCQRKEPQTAEAVPFTVIVVGGQLTVPSASTVHLLSSPVGSTKFTGLLSTYA